MPHSLLIIEMLHIRCLQYIPYKWRKMTALFLLPCLSSQEMWDKCIWGNTRLLLPGCRCALDLSSSLHSHNEGMYTLLWLCCEANMQHLYRGMLQGPSTPEIVLLIWYMWLRASHTYQVNNPFITPLYFIS